MTPIYPSCCLVRSTSPILTCHVLHLSHPILLEQSHVLLQVNVLKELPQALLVHELGWLHLCFEEVV